MRMPDHLAEKDAMRCVILGVDDLAVEYRQPADQRRRAARNAVPLGQREALLDRQAGLAGKSLRERLLVVRERIQRKIAVPDEGFVLEILAVEADEDGRRRVGYGAGGDHGCAAFARRPVSGDDVHRARKPRHRIAIGLRPYFVLLQHS